MTMSNIYTIQQKEEFIDDDGFKQTFYYYKENITEKQLYRLHPQLKTHTNIGVKYRDGYTLVYHTEHDEEEEK